MPRIELRSPGNFGTTARKLRPLCGERHLGEAPAGLDLRVVVLGRIDLQGSVHGLVRDREISDLTEATGDPDGDSGLVEREASTDRHEVLLAGLGGDLRRIEECGIPVMNHDLTAVDSAGRIAPFGKRAGQLEELAIEPGLHRVAGIGKGGDIDRVPGNAPHGGGTA